jgi:hypothetical protein
MQRQNFRPYQRHLRHPVDLDKINAEHLAAAKLETVAVYLEIAAAALLDIAVAAYLEIAAAALLEIAAAAYLEIAAAVYLEIAAAAYLAMAAAALLEIAAGSSEIAAAAKVPVAAACAAAAVALEIKKRVDPMNETNFHFQPYPWLDHDLEARAAVAEGVSGRFQP